MPTKGVRTNPRSNHVGVHAILRALLGDDPRQAEQAMFAVSIRRLELPAGCAAASTAANMSMTGAGLTTSKPE